MYKKFTVICLLLAAGLMVAGAAEAQTETPRPTPTNEGAESSPAEERGSIRGTVFLDENGDGRCLGTGEPPLGGVNVRFVSNDGATELTLQTGTDGTYGLVAAGLGTWTVSALPPTGFAVTSAQSRSVTLDSAQLVVTGIDFCVSRDGTRGVVLPDSGAPIAPIVLSVVALLGLVFIGLGAGYQARQWRRRRGA